MMFRIDHPQFRLLTAAALAVGIGAASAQAQSPFQATLTGDVSFSGPGGNSFGIMDDDDFVVQVTYDQDLATPNGLLTPSDDPSFGFNLDVFEDGTSMPSLFSRNETDDLGFDAFGPIIGFGATGSLDTVDFINSPAPGNDENDPSVLFSAANLSTTNPDAILEITFAGEPFPYEITGDLNEVSVTPSGSNLTN